MEFIDSTGHIFSLPSYEDKPINLEYVEGDYIFWLKDSSVSINNYYIKPVRFLLDEKFIKDSIDIDDNGELISWFSLEVSNSSQFYKLISPKYLQSQLEQSNNISKPIGLDKSQFVDKLTLDDFYFDLNGIIDYSTGLLKEEDDLNLVVTSGTTSNKFYMFPFYVVGYSDIEGTFLNNVMIKYSYNKDKIEIVGKELTRDEYYDYTLKHSISPIQVYQWDKINGEYTNKRLVLTIKPSYKTQLIDDQNSINNGLNKYEILFNGDGIEKDPNNPISDNILSSVYSEDDEKQANQNKRVRSTKYNGELAIGQLPVEEYIYIYKLDNVLPQGYYTFEGSFYESTSFLPLTTLPIPYMGFNYDGYHIGDPEDENDDLDSLYPEDENKVGITEKFMCGTLEILNPDIVTNKDNYITRENGIVKYSGYQISNEYYLNTPVKEFPQIRDFWFLLINKDINEGKNGRYVENYNQVVINKYYNYTPITIGCSFIDECEELIINGNNMGIRLPKEILKAIYNSSFYSKNADEKLLKNKLKELLLNYMNIKGETGNFKSMINSLKWFGWNKHINISQLIKTDNEFQNQFVLDYFDIHNDIKETFKYFNKTNNISLTVSGNREIGENYQQDYTNVFIGEGKPKLEDLFAKNVEVVKDDITFYKPYYNFIFNELALKLDCLKYYYQQYFLPVHININRASIAHKVYANTTKLAVVGFSSIIDKPFYMPSVSDNIRVKFPDTNRLVFKQDNHIIDDKFNEFSNYNDSNPQDLYYVNENCVTIPITLAYDDYEYIKEANGLYLLIDDEYVKINYFYKYKDDSSIKEITDDHDNALFYSFEKNKDIKPLLNIDRYNRYSKLYSKDNKGDYFIDKEGNYIKMNYFYKMINEDSAILSNKDEATHFSIVKNEEIQDLNDYLNNRYSKISEYYFNCKLILTATIINQDPSGHYIKLGDKYIYKEKFYKSDFSETSNLANENYIKYYENYIRIDSKNRYNIQTIYLLDDNNFNYYQNVDQYYKNFVLIPRLLNNYIDYEKAYFRLSLMVNDKWFNYDFRIVTPNIYLDLGKLEYKYAITNGDNVYYPFKQLKSLSPLRFNSFIYEPDLVTINTLFKEKDNKGNNRLLTFLDKLLETDDGTNNPDQYKMYEFYKKYYSDIIRVPYNTKYYNRIHVFDIYDQNNDKVYYEDKIYIDTSKYLCEGYRGSYSNTQELYNNVKFYFVNNKRIKYIKYLYISLTHEILLEDDGVSYYPSKNSYQYILVPVSNDIDNNIFEQNIEHGYNIPDLDYSVNINNCLIINKFLNFHDKFEDDEYQDEFINYFLDLQNRFNIQFTGVDCIYNNVEKYIDKANETTLYQTFFNSNLSYKHPLNESVVYDYYLMHDDKEWYMVAISQYPIASYPEADLLNIHNKEHTIGGYHVVYADYSIDKFLVNRMVIKKANGYNQFNKDDLIIVGVNNNDYQFNIDLNNKWTISRIYDVNSVYDVNSNTNLTIITNDNIDNLYTPGYYNVKLQYTINGLNNILHNAIAQYKVLDTYQNIKYPEIIEPVIEEEIFNIKDTISDFTILYENSSGQQYKSKDILDPSLGWEPIGIKVMNKYYYSPEQDKSIYIGLKWLTVKDPDNGFSASGNLYPGYNPLLGFKGIDIVGLKNYRFIAYKDPEHTIKIGEKSFGGTTISNPDTCDTQTENIWPQTDYIDNLTSSAKNSDGSPKWPAPNDRAFHRDPASNQIINILNDNDTLNTSLLDEDCAAYDWNGKLNTQIMIDNFDEEDLEFMNWRTSQTIWNNSYYKKFSPAAACAWRYHTKTTNQGDWYLPSFAEILCLTYNFKRLTELFNNISEKYPQCCKPDLLDYLNSPNGDHALWTSTEYNKNMMWEIHPNHHIHALGKDASWNAFPFIQIDD